VKIDADTVGEGAAGHVGATGIGSEGYAMGGGGLDESLDVLRMFREND